MGYEVLIRLSRWSGTLFFQFYSLFLHLSTSRETSPINHYDFNNGCQFFNLGAKSQTTFPIGLKLVYRHIKS
jgi:hypothetical protein